MNAPGSVDDPVFRAGFVAGLEIAADECHAEFEARDTNDGSVYCTNCGEAEHDPECVVARIRGLAGASASPGPGDADPEKR